MNCLNILYDMCCFLLLYTNVIYVFLVYCLKLTELNMEKPVNRGRGVTKKATGNSRRVWTNKEEAVLIAALKDLVSNDWKLDNGFRTGYLTKLEDALKTAFPNTDLQKNPNIVSKLTTWRKYYGSLVSVQRDTTEVGYNTTPIHSK